MDRLLVLFCFFVVFFGCCSMLYVSTKWGGS